MIVITAKIAGFCRCGVSHPATATEYPDDRFSAEQLKQLQAEPMLVVQVVASGSGKSGNVADTVALVGQAQTVEDLDKLAEGETRKGVVDAIAKRRAELAGGN